MDEAAALIRPLDFSPYLELKELLTDTTEVARERFRSLFTNFYRLNSGGVTDLFKDRFFEILFSGNVIVNGQPDFAAILTELSGIKRRKGDYAMPFSFVSKLVGIHLESSPIYDAHVRTFFRAKTPGTKVEEGKRIAWFIGFLKDVATSYHAWASDERVKPALAGWRRASAALRFNANQATRSMFDTDESFKFQRLILHVIIPGGRVRRWD